MKLASSISGTLVISILVCCTLIVGFLYVSVVKDVQSYEIFTKPKYTRPKMKPWPETLSPRHHKHRQTSTDNVIFVIRTFPNNFGTRLAEQAETWIKELELHELLVSSSTAAGGKGKQLPQNIPQVNLIQRHCPSGHALGPACTEASALIHLWNNTDNNNFDWAFIIDDDVLVFL